MRQTTMNKLIEVLEVQTYSGKDAMMREYLNNELESMPGVEFWDDGDNIYAGKGTGPRACVVAHMDTVHPIVEDLTAVVLNGRITGMNAVTMEQTGIGGDDKVGIYVALQMLKEHDNIKAFFPRDEEIGCRGSALVETSFFDDVTIVLQCDRKGNTDFVTRASGTELSSLAFQSDVLPIIQNYGYKFSDGLMTDVQELKEQGIKCSMANISCGYYNPHSETEYVSIADVHRVTMMVSDIIKQLGSTFYPHEAPARPKYKYTEWWNDDNPWDRDDKYHRALEAPRYCADCGMQPSSGPNGFCDECWEWHKRMERIKEPTKVPQISVTVQRPKTVGDAIKSINIFKKKKRNKRK